QSSETRCRADHSCKVHDEEKELPLQGCQTFQCGGRAKCFDQFSFEQSRGVIFLSVAYLAETSFTMGSVIVSSAVYQSEIQRFGCRSHRSIRSGWRPLGLTLRTVDRPSE